MLVSPLRQFYRRIVLIDPPSSIDILVIGAGPTGLGAAKRLHQLVPLPNCSGDLHANS